MNKVKVTPNDVVDAAVEYCENELSKAADEAQGRVKNGIDGKIADFNAKVDATIDGAVEGTKERVKAWASKTLNKVSGGKMWGSPSCWMHLMFVEFRWMILVYYTCYTLVISTVYAIDLHAHSGDTGSDDSLFVPLIACMGGAQFEAQLSLGVRLPPLPAQPSFPALALAPAPAPSEPRLPPLPLLQTNADLVG